VRKPWSVVGGSCLLALLAGCGGAAAQNGTTTTNAAPQTSVTSASESSTVTAGPPDNPIPIADAVELYLVHHGNSVGSFAVKTVALSGIDDHWASFTTEPRPASTGAQGEYGFALYDGHWSVVSVGQRNVGCRGSGGVVPTRILASFGYKCL